MLEQLKAGYKIGCLVSICFVARDACDFPTAIFLFGISKSYQIEFVIANTIPAFIYIIMNPDLKATDLSLLPRSARTISRWVSTWISPLIQRES